VALGTGSVYWVYDTCYCSVEVMSEEAYRYRYHDPHLRLRQRMYGDRLWDLCCAVTLAGSVAGTNPFALQL
jgi:hypothetical protein